MPVEAQQHPCTRAKNRRCPPGLEAGAVASLLRNFESQLFLLRGPGIGVDLPELLGRPWFPCTLQYLLASLILLC